MLTPLVPSGRLHEFDEQGDLDFSARGDAGDRFRINLFRSTGHAHAAIRRVQSKIPSFEELNLPDVYRQTIMQSLEGLILVSGVTGSGKSSTLAAMLDHINDKPRPAHHHRSRTRSNMSFTRRNASSRSGRSRSIRPVSPPRCGTSCGKTLTAS